MKNGDSNSYNFSKYLNQCKNLVEKHSTKNINQLFGDNGLLYSTIKSSKNINQLLGDNGFLSTTIKLSSKNSFAFPSTVKDTNDVRLSRNYTRFKEIKDSPTKYVPINKKNFPINIFLLTSKKLENRPTKKFEVFLGKYVRSYLVNDAQDPLNKRIRLSRKDTAIFGTVHNHLLNKENVRSINNLSRVNYQTKSESRNTSLHVKLPNSLSKSSLRPNILSEDTFVKTKSIDSFPRIKLKVSKFNEKNFIIRSNNKKGDMLKSFNKDDFYYI